jgi:hypothetical protein
MLRQRAVELGLADLLSEIEAAISGGDDREPRPDES